MYSISGYGDMIVDKVRMEAFDKSLSQAVKPGSVVVDIGTGPGIFAMLACRYGARKVYAIETDDVIQLAKTIAAANGFATQIEFIQASSTETTLPEKADVIISDMRGVLPLFNQHLPSIMDARQRLLADGGTLIAQCDTLWAALVESEKRHPAGSKAWSGNEYNFDMKAALPLLTNTWHKTRIKDEQLLVEPACWATIDYTTVSSPNLAAEVCLTARRNGTAHGIALWFDCTPAEGVCFSNAPGSPEAIYGQAFFPLSTPVELITGDSITLKLRADLVGEEYNWCWATQITARDNPCQIKARFSQTSLFGAPLSPAKLAKRSAGFVPRLGDIGMVDHLILTLMADATPLGQIAEQLTTRFPSLFATNGQALTHVGELSLKYSRD